MVTVRSTKYILHVATSAHLLRGSGVDVAVPRVFARRPRRRRLAQMPRTLRRRAPHLPSAQSEAALSRRSRRRRHGRVPRASSIGAGVDSCVQLSASAASSTPAPGTRGGPTRPRSHRSRRRRRGRGPSSTRPERVTSWPHTRRGFTSPFDGSRVRRASRGRSSWRPDPRAWKGSRRSSVPRLSEREACPPVAVLA